MQPPSKQQDSWQYFNSVNYMGTMEKERSPSDNVYITSMSAPLQYGQMVSVVPPPTPRQTIIASPSGNSKLGKKYLLLRILVSVVTIIALIATMSYWYRKRAAATEELKKLQEGLIKMKNELDTYDWNQVEREINSEIPDSIDGNRYKRSDGDPFKNYKDYDFERLNEATLALVNTLEKSGKLVYEQPRYSGLQNHPLFKRNIRNGSFFKRALK